MEICSIANASQVSCEHIANLHWVNPARYVKTCYIGLIKFEGDTISPRDEIMQGLCLINRKKTKFLPLKVAETFPNLLAYSADRNSLTKINKANFAGLNKLEKLSLSYNHITTIRSDTFEDLIALEELELGK